MSGCKMHCTEICETHNDPTHSSKRNPRAAGLWISLTDLPLFRSGSALSTSLTLGGYVFESCSVCGSAPRSPEPDILNSASSTLQSCPYTSPAEVSWPSDGHGAGNGAVLDESTLLHQTPSQCDSTAMSLAPASQGSECDASSCSVAQAAACTPGLLPALESRAGLPDTGSSFELSSRASPGSDLEPDQAESCTDAQSVACGHASVCGSTSMEAHPVSLLSTSLQHVVSPPMSSIDGDDAGSGPLHGGIALATLNSVDGGVTDTGNASDGDQGGAWEGEDASVPPSVNDAPVDTAELKDEATFYVVCPPQHAQHAPVEGDSCDCDRRTTERGCSSGEALRNDLEVDAPYSARSCSTSNLRHVQTAAGAVLSAHTEASAGASSLYRGNSGAPPECGGNDLEGGAGVHAGELHAAAAVSRDTRSELDRPGGASLTDRCLNTVPGDPHAHGARHHSLEWPVSASRSATRVLFQAADSGPLQPLPYLPPLPALPPVHLCVPPMSITSMHASSSRQSAMPAGEQLRSSRTVATGDTHPRRTKTLRRVRSAPGLAESPARTSFKAERLPGQDSAAMHSGTCLHMRMQTPPPLPAPLPARAPTALARPALPPLTSLAALAAPSHTPLLMLPMHVQCTTAVPASPLAVQSSLSLAEGGYRGTSCTLPQNPARYIPEEPTVTTLCLRPPAVSPPDVPIHSSPFALLDQHLLDRIMMHVSATHVLTSVAAVCRRFRNSARRLTASATLLPSSNGRPPVDPATGALDLRPLRSFSALHRLRLPKFERTRPVEVLSVELFRLRMLTQLTYLDIQCAAFVPTFQPLRLLPALQHLSCAGASLNPPPDIPELPNCEVMLYANRGLSAATRRNVLATLPPLSGLRVPSKAPAALLQQIGSSPSMRTLTYLRLGSCQAPALNPLSPLTRLARLHLHVVNGHVTPLTTLSMLTYLHLHGQVDDLAVALGSFQKLQKLSLIKCKRLRPDEVRAVGTLSALTSLELPCSKASSPPRDIRPLARLKNLQHLSVAMPEAGIGPLAKLTALTFLRLKYRAPDEAPNRIVPQIAFTASLFSMHLAVSVRAFGAGAAGDAGGGGAAAGGSPPPSLLSGAMGSVLQTTSQAALHTAVTLAGAAAFPLAAYATRRLWSSVHSALFPPALDAGCLADLCQMTQLEWLEVKSCTMPTAGEWAAALPHLTRLRRLDVRNTTFCDPVALQGMPSLRVVLINGCTGLPRNNGDLKQAGGLRDDVEIRR